MAGGARGGDDDDLITAINVTPLVDVVLVLLIILMVTATAIVRNETIPVELPEAATGERERQEPTTLPVSVTAEGAIYLEEEELTLDELRTRAQAAHQRDPETRAILHADGRVPHAQVVRVIDALRQADVTKFAINVRPSDLAAPAPGAAAPAGEAPSH
jgi:biopolymer transport protein ExbD